MWEDPAVISDEFSVAVGSGMWSYGFNPLSLSFYKQVRVIGVQATMRAFRANGVVEAQGYMVIQQRTNKGQSSGTFGGNLFYIAVNTGTSVQNVCEIDIPANNGVTVIGTGGFYVVTTANTTVILYMDIIYQTKRF